MSMDQQDLLKELTLRADAFVNDVMPQIGKLCIQDFENLNELCMLLTQLKREMT